MTETRAEKLSIAKGLEINASSTSSVGQIITYLRKMPSHNSELARLTLIARYLPFVLEPSNPHYRAKVLACAIDCESWGRAIREYCGLPLVSTGVHSYPLVSPVTPVPSVSSTPLMEESNSVVANQLPVTESDEDLLNKFEQELQVIVDSASGAQEALDELVKLQPKQEKDWTEDQWDLWDEYSNQQQDIVHRQMLGDLGKTQKPVASK